MWVRGLEFREKVGEGFEIQGKIESMKGEVLQFSYHSFICGLAILFKLYFIDYAITVVPIFPSGNPHTIVHVHGSCI